MFGKWIKSIIVAGLLVVAGFAAMTMNVEARIGPVGSQYDRSAMVYEAYYAVTGQLGNYPTSQTLGQWNYMAYDISSTRTIVNRIGRDNAGWSPTAVIDGNVQAGFKDNRGRGGQCLYFINTLLYRSEADRRDASSGTCNYCWASIEAYSVAIDSGRYMYQGDIVFRPRSLGRHIAVVVYRSGDNVRLVESNYLGDEIASIRPTTVTWLRNNGYRVYTGVSYYNK